MQRFLPLAMLASLMPFGALVSLRPATAAPVPAIEPERPPITSNPDSSSLDLEYVLGRVLERNPSIAASRASWAEARAHARQAGALEDPMLDVMAAPRSFGSSSVSSAYRIGIAQAFPLFGQRGLRGRMAEIEAGTAGWDLRSAQLDLVHQAKMAYADYWEVARAISLNRELLALFPQLRRVSLARYSAGLIGQQEPLQVDAELAMLDHQAVVLERQRLVAVAVLNVLMHDPPDHWLPPPPREIPLPDTGVVHADLAPRARALRPEMRAADVRVEASRAGVALAGRQGLPETSFGVAYDRFWGEPELRTTVGITMNLPVNLGRLSAARAESRARLETSIARQEVVRDSVELQVAMAAARLHEQAHDVAIARERLLPLAERALHASRASYEANRTDFLTVLNSLRGFLTARLETDQSLAMLYRARADLDRALGELPSALKQEKLP